MLSRPASREIPDRPGVYRFSDADGVVCYVGKAKRLRARVGSYFNQVTHPRTQAMLERATTVDWIVCESELEALVLESRLIAELDPPYNVKLKEHHPYPYVAITRSPTPRVMVWHGPARANIERFGPFPKNRVASKMVELAGEVLGVRSCSDATMRDARRRGVACLLGEIGRCSAPCVDRISAQDYDERVVELRGTLRGDVRRTVTRLEQAMRAAAETHEFEQAARIRDQIRAIESAGEHQRIIGGTATFDAVGIHCDDLGVAVNVVRVEHGAVIDTSTFVAVGDGMLGGHDLWDVVVRAYLQSPARAREVAVALTRSGGIGGDADGPGVDGTGAGETLEADGVGLLQDAASDARGRRVSVRVAKRGRRREAAELACVNAAEALKREATARDADPVQRSDALGALAAALGVPGPLWRIECFDVAHLQGDATYVGMSVLTDGLPDRAEYRWFGIADGRGDDYAALAQAVRRRFANADQSGAWPSLVVIDGGQGQLRAAQTVLEKLSVSVPLCSLAKEEEAVWLPGASEALQLGAGPARLLLQRIRDEAHRFSRVAHHRARTKQMTASALDGVKGLGPGRQVRLLREFGTLDAIVAGGRAGLDACSWLPAGVRDALWAHLSGVSESPPR